MMTDYQVARYDMVSALLEFFRNNMGIVSMVEDLTAMIALLTTDRNAISAVAVERDETKTAVKNVKPASREALGAYTFTYSRKLRALGKKSNITELISLSCPPLSEIDKMRFSNLSEYSEEVAGFLNKYVLQLSGQQVTQAEIDEYQGMIDLYKETISKTDAKRDEGIEETGDLEESFTQMMSRVYVIDDIIDGMRKKQKEFCDTYDVTRVVRTYGLRHRTPEEVEILQARAEAKKVKRAMARKEKLSKAKAEKLRKLMTKNSSNEVIEQSGNNTSTIQ